MPISENPLRPPERTARLQDKVVIVTGASSGLGAAVAMVLANDGAKVVLAARRQDKGEEVLRRIVSSGGDGLFIRTDVTRRDDLENMVARTVERFGCLDGAVNNAACNLRSSYFNLRDLTASLSGAHSVQHCSSP